ncbi:hypothetical protein M434DRAFT_392489 [Hypoxylon sp. CO27-5]|nr:hypothetical protein M434DRAFT_392489 [Hypoxylon sp. CO27-5]
MASYSTNAEIAKSEKYSDSSPNNLHIRRAKVIYNAHIGAFIGAILAFSTLIYFNDGAFPSQSDFGSYVCWFIAFGSWILGGFFFPIFATRDGVDLVWVDIENSIRKLFRRDADA